MGSWDVKETANGLQLSPRRSLGSEEFTWADLLYRKLAAVHVYVLYFPSRFDLEFDGVVRQALEAFGRDTPWRTQVNVWNPADPEFARALALFDLKYPPALVLATGLAPRAVGPAEVDRTRLYRIAISDPAVLGNRAKLAAAINSAHEVLVRGDPKEISGYVRECTVGALIAAIGSIAAEVRDEMLKCKPTFGLPGGFSIQLGG
jgi:hypothetical protein